MIKYRAQITVEFETKTAVPDVSMSGTVKEVGGVFERLPNMDDVDENTATATLRVERVL